MGGGADVLILLIGEDINSHQIHLEWGRGGGEKTIVSQGLNMPTNDMPIKRTWFLYTPGSSDKPSKMVETFQPAENPQATTPSCAQMKNPPPLE